MRIYFISDLHLGVEGKESSLNREKKFVQWMDFVAKDATEIYLLGDIFDMWFEYKHVIPRGYSRVLGKFAELSDRGIQFHYFTGNHDMWIKNYFAEEMAMKIYHQPIRKTFNNKTFYIGHGDGLGKGDLGYKTIKRIFSGKLNQWLFARLHPNFGFGLANYFSKKSRAANGKYDGDFESLQKEILVQFCINENNISPTDYFIFGHRHLKMDVKIGENSRYINLGQWLSESWYARFDGTNLELKSY